MVNKAINIDSHPFSEGEKFLVDANIWLYLYPPPSASNTYGAKMYSGALKAMLGAKSAIIINALILSEYLNRYCRIEWEALYKVKFAKYKEFRLSNEYRTVGGNAAAFAREILKLGSKIDDEFVAADLPKVLSGFESGENDFNDGLIADACRRNAWKLVTHDGDFTQGEIEVLTGNQKLLKACAS